MNILLIFPGFIVAFFIVLCYECKIRRTEPRNKVHFYVARDMDGELHLYMGKPIRHGTQFCFNPDKGVSLLPFYSYEFYGLNEKDYANLEWEDEPLGVFVNMED